MNLLLLGAHEVDNQTATVSDRRAAHVLGLLAKEVGDTVRIGVVGTGVAIATVIEADRTLGRVRLQLGPLGEQLPPTTSLVLALPRPKALSRIVSAIASFGVRHVDLIQTRKVDPAYFSSPRLAPARLDEDALLGLEQGGWVHLPTFAVHRSFSRFVRSFEARSGDIRVLFDPSGLRSLLQVLEGADAPSSPVTLAFGPDGGFLAEEVERLSNVEFQPATLSHSVLRTEVAVAAGLGQLDLARSVMADLSRARSS